MRLKKISGNKRGLSEIVSYVLLIFIAFSVATLIFVLLKNWFDEPETPGCPTEGVTLAIKEVTCVDETNNIVSITIKNTGLFNIDALVVKGNNNPNVDSWSDLEDDGNPATLTPELIIPGESIWKILDSSGTNEVPLEPNNEAVYTFKYDSLGSINKVFIGGARKIGNEWSVCESAYAAQEVICA